VSSARDTVRFAPGVSEAITVADLNAASRRHSDQRIGASATKINPQYGWDDIVLPPDQKEHLREICNYFSNRAIVYESWGFQRKTDLGKGLNVMFAGQSGTGKTMAAGIMANELGLDLYKIDLSGVVSKYIGETEKNLDRIFDEAQDSNAILFFDEADALFGKRSEVKDAHDRYANIETSYLLQKMDEYQGIVVLATNYRKNMDDAFIRRMHFSVEFPIPEEPDRLEIWRRVFPEEAPMNGDVDRDFLARQFKIPGGNIKNIAVSSAFLAAQDRAPIGMAHVMLAAKREFQKMGKLLLESEFGQYFDIVRPVGRR
jgi:SpoVK/Ycf46/Vps4 family AAA+-type ATPase